MQANFTVTISQVQVYDKFGDARPKVKHPADAWQTKWLYIFCR